MNKKEQSSRQFVLSQIMIGMSIELAKAKQLMAELEDTGLIQFDPFGNLSILLLEEHHEANHS